VIAAGHTVFTPKHSVSRLMRQPGRGLVWRYGFCSLGLSDCRLAGALAGRHVRASAWCYPTAVHQAKCGRPVCRLCQSAWCAGHVFRRRYL